MLWDDPNQMPWCKSYGPILRHWSSPWFVQMVIESLLFKRAMIGAVAVQECRELTQIPNLWETKNRENTRQWKTITRTRQYLRGSAICLCLRSCKDFTIIKEKYKCGNIVFQSLKNNNNNKTLITKNGFYILRTGFTMGYKMGQKIFPWALWLGPVSPSLRSMD